MKHLSLFLCQPFRCRCNTGTPSTVNYWLKALKVKNYSDHYGLMCQKYFDCGCQLSVWLINLLWLVKFNSSVRKTPHLHRGSLVTHSVCKSSLSIMMNFVYLNSINEYWLLLVCMNENRGFLLVEKLCWTLISSSSSTTKSKEGRKDTWKGVREDLCVCCIPLCCMFFFFLTYSVIFK